MKETKEPLFEGFQIPPRIIERNGIQFDLSGFNPFDYYMHLFNKIPHNLQIGGQTHDFSIKYGDEAKIKLEDYVTDLCEKYPDAYIRLVSDASFGATGICNHHNTATTLVVPGKEVIVYVEYSNVTFLYDNEESVMEFVKTLNDEKYIESVPTIKQIYLVTRGMGGYELVAKEAKDMEVDIRTNYNDDFIEKDQIIRNFLSEDNTSGLVILNGEKGTGKTTYLRHLINQINRKFIYITADMAQALTDPGFISFLGQMQDSVLILEDCESLVESRKSGARSTGIANMLNLCDGLLSDIFNIKIITTFNADISRIDDALLRKGRLICWYEFKKLCVEKTNALFKKLGIDHISDKDMPICDIFNFDKENGIAEDKDGKVLSNNKKVGFYK